MKRYIITSLFSIFWLQLHAQQQVLTTNNSQFLAISKFIESDTLPNGFVNLINIYETETFKWLHSLKFESKQRKPIDKLLFSANGEFIQAQQDDYSVIWNIKSGGVVTTIPHTRLLTFAHRDNFFVALVDNQLKAFHVYSGSEVMAYETMAGETITSIEISENDQYIIAKSSDKQVYIWYVLATELKKKISATDIKFDKGFRTVVLLENSGTDLLASVYELPKIKLLHSISSAKVMKIKQQEELRKLKTEYTDTRNKALDLPEIMYDEAKLSNDGKYFALPINFTNGDQEIIVINCFTGDMAYNIRSKDFTQKINLHPFIWSETNQLVIRTTELSAGIFDVENQRFVEPLTYKFNFRFNEKRLSEEEQLKYHQISPDGRYVALPYNDNDKSLLFMRSGDVDQEKVKLTGIEFLGFSKNSDIVFVTNPKGQIQFFRTSQLDHSIAAPQLFSMNERLTDFFKEELIENDAPPEGYTYQQLRSFKHISTLTDADSAKLYFSTMETSDSTSGIRVHLIDKYGNYYYGAAEPEWRHLWSNFKLQYPDSTVHDIKNFTVTETREQTEMPNAIVIVMDHSGSMGDQRSLKLQEAVAEFIKTKRPIDAMAILKYDHRVTVDATLSSDAAELLNNIEITGNKGFGGTTALVDAANRAIYILKSATGFYRKSVIVLTDGYENSSFLPKNEVVKSALKDGIHIFTIGYGEAVSEGFLKSMSYVTKGSFHHIYGQNSFQWIFMDIYYKMNNFYTLRFSTPQRGEYKVLLETQLIDKRIDSFYTVIDNKPFDPTENDEFDEEIAESPIEETPVNFNELVDVFKTTTTVKSDKISTTPNTDSIPRKESGLPYVEFYFDKTVIVEKTLPNIESVVEFMKQNPKIRIEICGHTDYQGSDQYNIKLSQRRCNKVKELLLSKGIATERLVLNRFGEKVPKADNTTAEGRARNRRVEFYIVE